MMTIQERFDGLGRRLSLVIKHLAISQSEFARQLGASPGFVSDVVRGVKRPGGEFLLGIKQTFGISADWLLAGDGTMFGGAGINLDLFRAIRLQVALARAGVVDANECALRLLVLIRDGHLKDVAEPDVLAFVEQLRPCDDDIELVMQLYNGHIGTPDPVIQHRNILVAAVAYFEAHKPIDKVAALAMASGANIRTIAGVNAQNEG